MKKIICLLILVVILGFSSLTLVSIPAKATNTEYISPTGGSGEAWSNIPSAYDGDNDTYAAWTTTGYGVWSPPLILTHDVVSGQAIRYLVNRSASYSGEQIDLDAYYNDDWHDVFLGEPTWGAWQEKDLGGTFVITQVRIAYYSNAASPHIAKVQEEQWVIVPWPPSDLAELTGYAVSGNNTAFDWLVTPPDMPPTMYTELDTSKVPGGDVVDAILGESGITGQARALWWFPFIFIGICIIGLLVYEATQRTGGEGSLLTMCIVIETQLIFFGILGATGVSSLIPLWPAFLFPFPSSAFILSRRHVGWG